MKEINKSTSKWSGILYSQDGKINVKMSKLSEPFVDLVRFLGSLQWHVSQKWKMLSYNLYRATKECKY